MQRTYSGSGHLIYQEREIPVQYEIISTKTPQKISASGGVSGVELADRAKLVGKSMKLRLQAGEEINVDFLGGNMAEDWSRLNINSEMPD